MLEYTFINSKLVIGYPVIRKQSEFLEKPSTKVQCG